MAIAAASDGLRQILWDGCASDRRINRLIGSREEISLGNPVDAATAAARRLNAPASISDLFDAFAAGLNGVKGEKT